VSWITKELSEVCEIKLGKTPSRSDKSFWDVEKISNNKWASIADLSKVKGRNIFDTKEYISEKGAKLFNPVEANTILMSFKLSIGKLAITTEKIYTNEAIVALPIKIKDKIRQDFLFYYLQFYDWDKESENDIKVKGKTLNKEKLKKIKVPLPPIPTQQRIVAKLDAIFAEIDTATASAEANASNAEALFQSYLTEVFASKENLTKLKDCTQIKPPKSEIKNLKGKTSVSFMPMESLGINGKFTISKQTKYLESVSGSYTYFTEGDVLLAKITPCFENGKLGIANNLVNGIGFGSSEYIVFRPNKNIDKEWLYYFLNRESFRILGSQHMSGSVGHKRVTKEFIEDTLIPLIPIAKQNELVSKIDNVFLQCQTLKKVSQSKIRELVFLKQSILKQAFSGELVKD
jgi:type I restriction enzyme S subunit